MTSLLAIETSMDACSVAIAYQNIVQESFVLRPRQHNQIILSMVQDLLQSAQLTLADMDAIAFGAGPGSFTGLRLSAGITQGLAFAAQNRLSLFPVSPHSRSLQLKHWTFAPRKHYSPSLMLVCRMSISVPIATK